MTYKIFNLFAYFLLVILNKKQLYKLVTYRLFIRSYINYVCMIVLTISKNLKLDKSYKRFCNCLMQFSIEIILKNSHKS